MTHNVQLGSHQSRGFVALQRREAPMLEMSQLSENECLIATKMAADHEGIELTDEQIALIDSSKAIRVPMCIRLLVSVMKWSQRIDKHDEIKSRIQRLTSITSVDAFTNECLMTFHRDFEDVIELMLKKAEAENPIPPPPPNALGIHPPNPPSPQTEQQTVGFLGFTMALIYVTRRGLSDGELVRVIKACSKNRVGGLFSPLCKTWKDEFMPLLSKVLDELTITVEGFRFFKHEVIRSSVWSLFIHGPENRIRYHSILSTFFQNQISKPTLRLLRELPWHLERAANWHQMKQVLVNIKMFDLWKSTNRLPELLKHWMLIVDRRTNEPSSNINSLTLLASTSKRSPSHHSSKNTKIINALRKGSSRPYFDIVDEFNTSVEEWVEKEHPDNHVLASMLQDIDNFLILFAEKGLESLADVPTCQHPQINENGLAKLGLKLSTEMKNKKDGKSKKTNEEIPKTSSYFHKRWTWVQFPWIVLSKFPILKNFSMNDPNMNGINETSDDSKGYYGKTSTPKSPSKRKRRGKDGKARPASAETPKKKKPSKSLPELARTLAERQLKEAIEMGLVSKEDIMKVSLEDGISSDDDDEPLDNHVTDASLIHSQSAPSLNEKSPLTGTYPRIKTADTRLVLPDIRSNVNRETILDLGKQQRFKTKITTLKANCLRLRERLNGLVEEKNRRLRAKQSLVDRQIELQQLLDGQVMDKSALENLDKTVKYLRECELVAMQQQRDFKKLLDFLRRTPAKDNDVLNPLENEIQTADSRIQTMELSIKDAAYETRRTRANCQKLRNTFLEQKALHQSVLDRLKVQREEAVNEMTEDELRRQYREEIPWEVRGDMTAMEEAQLVLCSTNQDVNMRARRNSLVGMRHVVQSYEKRWHEISEKTGVCTPQELYERFTNRHDREKHIQESINTHETHMSKLRGELSELQKELEDMRFSVSSNVASLAIREKDDSLQSAKASLKRSLDRSNAAATLVREITSGIEHLGSLLGAKLKPADNEETEAPDMLRQVEQSILELLGAMQANDSSEHRRSFIATGNRKSFFDGKDLNMPDSPLPMPKRANNMPRMSPQRSQTIHVTATPKNTRPKLSLFRDRNEDNNDSKDESEEEEQHTLTRSLLKDSAAQVVRQQGRVSKRQRKRKQKEGVFSEDD
eukprot:TRINITY_DN4043_c0_g1_i1.p1 TRINITY_DN4043_c0_g1~~TRINITY_DN4043_c0_g1_i1.p1  ORF type:complete len:1149 (+),score=392.63 TRINITY_DN4043_c0_g1_i1:382-3828(+)